MPQKHLRFALFGNAFQARKSVAIQHITDILKAHGAEVLIDRPYYEFLVRDQHFDIWHTDVFDDEDFTADFAVSLGGDGTFLNAASRVGAKGIPMLGVNMGRLGFLADVLPSEVSMAFEEIYNDTYKIEEHSVIQAEAVGEQLSGCPFYQADGLIISTPTGSTAYSLSNGGPIIVPSAQNLCITPVAPHSLNIRPIVINDNCEIELDVESRSHNFLIAIDGRSEKLTDKTKVVIRKAPYQVKIVKQHNAHYFSTLRDKLMWGADQRQQ